MQCVAMFFPMPAAGVEIMALPTEALSIISPYLGLEQKVIIKL